MAWGVEPTKASTNGRDQKAVRSLRSRASSRAPAPSGRSPLLVVPVGLGEQRAAYRLRAMRGTPSHRHAGVHKQRGSSLLFRRSWMIGALSSSRQRPGPAAAGEVAWRLASLQSPHPRPATLLATRQRQLPGRRRLRSGRVSASTAAKARLKCNRVASTIPRGLAAGVGHGSRRGPRGAIPRRARLSGSSIYASRPQCVPGRDHGASTTWRKRTPRFHSACYGGCQPIVEHDPAHLNELARTTGCPPSRSFLDRGESDHGELARRVRTPRRGSSRRDQPMRHRTRSYPRRGPAEPARRFHGWRSFPCATGIGLRHGGTQA